MLVVDLLHEFELGVWKAVFSHLIRILYAAGASGRLVGELDRRFVSASYFIVREVHIDESSINAGLDKFLPLAAALYVDFLITRLG
jgi:hypothetical protein